MADDGAWILWLTVVVAVAVFFLLGIAQKAQAKRKYDDRGTERIATAWNRMAVVLNGTVRWPERDDEPYGIDMLILGVDVNVLGGPEEKNSETFWLNVRADCQVPSWLRISVQCREGQEAIASQTHRDGDALLTTGTPAFDDHYQVTSNVPALAWALLDEGTLSRILGASQFEVLVFDGHVEARSSGQELDPSRLRHAVEAVARLARSYDDLRPQWARMAAAVVGAEPSTIDDIEPDWTTIFALLNPQSNLRIELASWTSLTDEPPIWLCTRIARRLESQLSVAQLALFRRARVVEADWGDESTTRSALSPSWAESLPEVEVGEELFGQTFEVHSGKPTTAKRCFTRDVREAIIRVAPETLVIQRSELVVTLPGLVLSQERLRDAAMLLKLLARPQNSEGLSL